MNLNIQSDRNKITSSKAYQTDQSYQKYHKSFWQNCSLTTTTLKKSKTGGILLLISAYFYHYLWKLLYIVTVIPLDNKNSTKGLIYKDVIISVWRWQKIPA